MIRTKLAALLAVCFAASSLRVASRRVARTVSPPGAGGAVAEAAEGPPRRLVAIANSDAFAETVLSVVVGDVPIAAKMGMTGELLDMADEVFGEAREMLREALGGGGSEPDRRLRGKRGRGAAPGDGDDDDDGERPLDETAMAVRNLYEQMSLDGQDTVGFSECEGRLLEHCKTIINRYLRANGLLRGSQKIDIQIFEKRPTVRDLTDEGSNKVVIITNPLGSAVAETPRYPDGWTWNGRSIGPWPACVGQDPSACCLLIREDVPDREEGRSIGCQFYTPGIASSNVKYPHPKDAEGNPVNGIIMYKSVDRDGRARVEETPYIQSDFALPS